MASTIYYIRPPVVGLAYEDWKDEASCNGLPPHLFELQGFEEIERGEQEETIAKGLKVCSGCPVRAACKSDSTPLDRYWTTRGGQPPEGLFLDSKMPGRYDTSAPPRKTPKKLCKHGHSDWATGKDGQRRCIPCRRQSDAVTWQRRKAKAAAIEGQSDA